MKCPCGLEMTATKWFDKTKWICSCGIMWWDGGTSTPATQEVFNLRKQCHKLFDELWKSGGYTRKNAYKRLCKIMELPSSKCHIGMFQKEECFKLLNSLTTQADKD